LLEFEPLRCFAFEFDFALPLFLELPKLCLGSENFFSLIACFLRPLALPAGFPRPLDALDPEPEPLHETVSHYAKARTNRGYSAQADA